MPTIAVAITSNDHTIELAEAITFTSLRIVQILWTTPNSPAITVMPNSMIMGIDGLRQTYLYAGPLNSVPATSITLLPLATNTYVQWDLPQNAPADATLAAPMTIKTLRIALRFFNNQTELTDWTGTNPALLKATPANPITVKLTFA